MGSRQARDAAEILSRWRRYLRIQRSLHPSTVSKRIRYAESWLTFLSIRGRDLWSATRDDALDWWEEQVTEYDGNTCAQILGSIRKLYEWLEMDLDEDEEVPRNHFVGYRAATHDPAERPTLTGDEVRRILALPVGSARGSPAVKLRDQALFIFLLSTGSRISAALAVNVWDVQPERHLVNLRKTKGDRPYQALLIPEAWEVLELYLRTARNVLLKSPRYGPLNADMEEDTTQPARTKTDALWIGRGGKRLGRGAALHAIRGLAERAGLATPIGPHGVRHTGATLLEEAGADLTEIQEYLGHKTVRTTQHYVHYDHLRKLRRVEAVHPLGEMLRDLGAPDDPEPGPAVVGGRGKVIPFRRR